MKLCEESLNTIRAVTMKSITEFKIEQWSSTVGVLSLSQLQALASKATSSNNELPPLIDPDLLLSYGTPAGSVRLRERIAELHSSPDSEGVKLTADNVIITPGSIMANYLALATLAGPGDHVICQHPTFTQLWEIPKLQGAEVTLWRMRPETNWEVDLDELETLIRPNTKAIIINNPNNPTGAAVPTFTLLSLISFASSRSITLYSDEVFSPLFHSQDPPSPAVPLVSLPSTNTTLISTGSLSKSFSLPGIRTGWIISPSIPLLDRIKAAHQYTTMAVSRLDDSVAFYALSPRIYPTLIRRNLNICKKNIDVVKQFVERNEERVEWVEPRGGATAWVRVLGKGSKKPVDDKAFCEELVEQTGVCVLPGGYCFGDGEEGDLKGYVRIVLGVEDPELLREGLRILEGFLETY
ncbi:aspartate aminotransferase [Cladorrhinum sp. PSN332]|nr:aspartate aminotransferase [Cladorrhinum sp. PSN332]